MIPVVNSVENKDQLLEKNVPLIQKSNDFIVTWTWIQEQPFIIDISIQNLKSTKQDVNITSIFKSLDTDDLKVTGFYEWKNVSREFKEPIYDIVISPNGTKTEKIVGYDVFEKWNLQWKPCKTRLFTKDKNDYKESYETINIPKINSKLKDATFNGTKLFRIEFTTKMEELSNGWGSQGVIALQVNDDVFDPVWLSNWDYRKSCIVTNSTGAGTNYQIKVTAHYGSGTDSDQNVYLNSRSQTDFDDVRFTDDDGETLLDIWVEETSVSDYAIFWVEVADSLETNQTIYIYYGNDDASSVSDIDATFFFADDWEDCNLNAWTGTKTDMSCSSDQPKRGTYSLKIYSTSGSYGVNNIYRSFTATENINLNLDYYSINKIGDSANFFRIYDATPKLICALGIKASTEKLVHLNGGWQDVCSITDGQYYKVQVTVDGSAKTYSIIVDDTEYVSDSSYYDGTAGNPARVYFFAQRGSCRTQYYSDDIRIGKWVDPEPIQVWGVEESVPFITFYNQTGSIFLVNYTRIYNGTVQAYNPNEVLQLQGIINHSFTFTYFNWTSSYVEVNPYNLTLTSSNLTIWLLVDPVSVGNGGLSSAWVLSGFLFLVIVLVPVVIMVLRRR